jgi:beta-N-acetylhexosaminidase
MQRACDRLDRLARCYPSRPASYEAAQHEADQALMRRAWAAGLTAVGDAAPPPAGRALRVFAQRGVPSDGVSEAGLPGDQVAQLFAGRPDVAFVLLDDLAGLDWSAVPADGRLNIVATNARERLGERARAWRPDLHLALWNPFQVLDVAAPAVVTWGYADGALAALKAWLDGRGPAAGRAPVALTRAGGAHHGS